MAALKILIVGPSTTKSKGGMATVIENLINNCTNDELELKHIASHVDGTVLDKILVFIKAFIAVLFEKNCSIIHIHVASDISIFRKSVFVFLSKILSIPVLMHVHGGDFDVFYNKCPIYVRYFIKKTFLMCDRIVVLSDYWKEFFNINISKHNVIVLNNGVNVEKYSQGFSTISSYCSFLFLGRLSKEKGVYDLLQAVDILVNTYHRNEFLFYLAGNGEEEQIRDFVIRKGLTNNIHLLGWVNEYDKITWLKKIDTFILPSYIEGLPMSIIEAMAAGKVIISSTVGGIPDLIKKENGFLITPGDITKLCEYILHINSNPNEMLKVSNNNYIKAARYYNQSILNDYLLRIYFDLAQVNRPKSRVAAEVYE